MNTKSFNLIHGAVALTAGLALFTYTAPVLAGASHGGGGVGGGSGTKASTYILFRDDPSDNIQSDLGDGNSPYINDQKGNVKVSFTSDGHLQVNTDTTDWGNARFWKSPSANRDLFIDFGVPITLTNISGTDAGAEWTVQTTDDFPALHKCSFTVGVFQGDFNMLTMSNNEVRPDVNFTLRLSTATTDQAFGTKGLIWMAPYDTGNGRFSELSDSVRVTAFDTDGDSAVDTWLVETQEDTVGNRAVVDQNEFSTHDEGELQPAPALPTRIPMKFAFFLVSVP